MSNAGGLFGWIGGINLATEGVWHWADGSSWGYTVFADQSGIIKDGTTACLIPMWTGWFPSDCAAERTFTCQFDPQVLKGNVNSSFTYTKEQLTESFQVGYTYKASSKQLLDSWKDKRMNGFRLSWRIENKSPPMEMKTSEIGRSFKTPGFGEDRFEEVFYQSDRVFTSTLHFPKYIEGGSDVLDVQLEVDTREEKGWQEEVRFGSKYIYHREPTKTWADAETHCQVEGGHLASVLTKGDQLELEAFNLNAWIGGNDMEEEGIMKWSNGEPWGYTEWRQGFGNMGVNQNCIMVSQHGWKDASCNQPLSFFCQIDVLTNFRKLRGTSNISIEYAYKNLTRAQAVQVKHYYVMNQKLSNSWEDKMMTGFRLSWFLRDSNGTRLTEKKPDLSADWTPKSAVPKYQDQYLLRMVQLANMARADNMTREDILILTMNEKAKFIHGKIFQYSKMCLGSQVNIIYYPTVFDSMGFIMTDAPSSVLVTDEDIETGFMMFSAIVYCSEPVALSQFLHSLLTDHSPRTIIKATVNTIQSNVIKTQMTKTMMNQFYLALDKVIHFEFGKLILATSSPEQVMNMLDNDRPYFSHFLKDIDQCFKNASCQRINDQLKSLGRQH